MVLSFLMGAMRGVGTSELPAVFLELQSVLQVHLQHLVNRNLVRGLAEAVVTPLTCPEEIYFLSVNTQSYWARFNKTQCLET